MKFKNVPREELQEEGYMVTDGSRFMINT